MGPNGTQNSEISCNFEMLGAKAVKPSRASFKKHCVRIWIYTWENYNTFSWSKGPDTSTPLEWGSYVNHVKQALSSFLNWLPWWCNDLAKAGQSLDNTTRGTQCLCLQLLLEHDAIIHELHSQLIPRVWFHVEQVHCINNWYAADWGARSFNVRINKVLL